MASTQAQPVPQLPVHTHLPADPSVHVQEPVHMRSPFGEMERDVLDDLDYGVDLGFKPSPRETILATRKPIRSLIITSGWPR